jgi:DNA-binding transcriptional ArsR family regulator
MDNNLYITKMKIKLNEAYGFDFPEDFWRFWDFYSNLKDEYKDLFSELLGIGLAGPFDFLRGRFEGKTIKLPYILHYRYYMDPPEFFTVLTGDSDGLHWGYWVDDLKTSEFSVAHYYNNDAYNILECGTTIFEAVRLYLEQRYHSFLEYMDEEEEGYVTEKLPGFQILRECIMQYETVDRKAIGMDYIDEYEERNKRKVSAELTYGMGIVVQDEFYKKMDNYSYKDLNLKKAEKLSMRAEKYLEEGFPGNALQIGKELWAYGERYKALMYPILEKAYKALGREQLLEILKIHREYREISSVDITQYIGKEYSSIEEALKDKEGAIVLKLNRKNLSELPDEIGELQKVTNINLYNNKLTELKPSFFNLINCEQIILSDNKLENIPPDIEKLKNLMKLSLERNKLTTLPEEISKLKKLELLCIYDNPISEEEKVRIKKLIPWATVF